MSICSCQLLFWVSLFFWVLSEGVPTCPYTYIYAHIHYIRTYMSVCSHTHIASSCFRTVVSDSYLSQTALKQVCRCVGV